MTSPLGSPTWNELLGIIVILSALNYFVIRLSIRASLSELIERLNGTYRRSKECDLVQINVNNKFEELEREIDALRADK